MSEGQVSMWRVKSFFDGLDKEARKHDIHEHSAFDSISSEIVWHVMLKCLDDDRQSAPVSTYELSNKCHTTRSRVRYRMIELCRYGLIKIQNDWRNDGSLKRRAALISVNPWLFSVMQTGCKPAHKLAAIKYFIDLGKNRRESDINLQGFKSDVPLGKEEPELSEIAEAQPKETFDELNDLIAKEAKEKADALREQTQWRKDSEVFVSGAGRLWTKAQCAMGHGSAVPAWAGDKKLLGPTVLRERQELVKVFQQYGGRVAALAWHIWTCGIAEIDDKTLKPVYDPSTPHRSFAQVDRRPSQFAKYLSAILMDQFFIERATKDWERVEPLLREYFGPTMDVRPKGCANDESLIGMKFGQVQDKFSQVVGR